MIKNEDIGHHMIKVIRPILNYHVSEDIQQILDRGGLSPRVINRRKNPLKNQVQILSMLIDTEQVLSLNVLLMITIICWNARSINTKGIL